MIRAVHLDNNASTAPDPRVVRAMVAAMAWGTSPSSGHRGGLRARAALEESRRAVRRLLGTATGTVVFTSGATESNNLAIKGLTRTASRRHMVTGATEHLSVLAPVRRMAEAGFEVVTVPVRGGGHLDLEALRRATTSTTLLVSVMAANNETGVTAPLAEVCRLAHEQGALVHSDATQVMAWGGMNVERDDLDLVSLSAHKFHGPQGVGALWIGPRAADALDALSEGGGQEYGLRSGTPNVAGIVGLGVAADLAASEGRAAAEVVAERRDHLHKLIESVGGVRLNGAADRRAAGTLNLSIDRLWAADLVAAVPEVLFSTGSACHSKDPAPSHVLSAMGVSPRAAASSVRFSLSRFTTDQEVEQAGKLVATAVVEIRRTT